MAALRDGSLEVFVNSSDGFADCWEPFFRLFELYGGSLRQLPLYLKTERSDYRHPSLSVTATKAWPTAEAERPNWSESFLRSLKKTKAPFILYLQEDYFLVRPVDDEWIAAAIKAMESDPSIGVIYLNRHGPQFTRARKAADLGFVEIPKTARYLVSTQAAIWRKDFLVSNLHSWENVWMFEKFGSLRARRSSTAFLSVPKQVMSTDPVVDYVYTGVMKGRWNRQCVDVFKAHGIHVDFSKRGFYQERGRLRSKLEVLWRVAGDPAKASRSIRTLMR
jgi:hypothetical protein